MRLEILSRVEQLGGSVFLEGEKLKARFPQGCSEANALPEELRAHRDEILHLLRQRQATLEEWKVPFSGPFYQSAVAILEQIRALPWKIGVRDWLKETNRDSTRVFSWPSLRPLTISGDALRSACSKRCLTNGKNSIAARSLSGKADAKPNLPGPDDLPFTDSLRPRGPAPTRAGTAYGENHLPGLGVRC